MHAEYFLHIIWKSTLARLLLYRYLIPPCGSVWFGLEAKSLLSVIHDSWRGWRVAEEGGGSVMMMMMNEYLKVCLTMYILLLCVLCVWD